MSWIPFGVWNRADLVRAQPGKMYQVHTVKKVDKALNFNHNVLGTLDAKKENPTFSLIRWFQAELDWEDGRECSLLPPDFKSRVRGKRGRPVLKSSSSSSWDADRDVTTQNTRYKSISWIARTIDPTINPFCIIKLFTRMCKTCIYVITRLSFTYIFNRVLEFFQAVGFVVNVVFQNGDVYIDCTL